MFLEERFGNILSCFKKVFFSIVTILGTLIACCWAGRSISWLFVIDSCLLLVSWVVFVLFMIFVLTHVVRFYEIIVLCFSLI